MSFLNRLEQRTPWLAFPGLFKAIIMIQALVIGVLMFRPEAALQLYFDWEAVKQGEVWRLFSQFALAPIRYDGAFSIIWIIFYVSIAIMFGDVMEATWGSWKLSFFLYTSMLSIIVINLVMSLLTQAIAPPLGGLFLYLSVFFVFAATYPLQRLNLFGILPVPVFILALLAIARGVFFLLSLQIFTLQLIALAYICLCLLPTLIYSVPRLIAMRRDAVSNSGHRARFKAKARAAQSAIHECHVCNRTELSSPELEFRVSADGEEYCDEHLPPKRDSQS